jgi:hypothetical protein
LPIDENNNSNNNADSNIKSNLIINRIIPITNGINNTNKSGIMSRQDISLIQNFELSPFLNNNELSLPFPNPHVLPQ